MTCACGCGQFTPIFKQTDPRTGAVAGQPMRFVRGHWRRKPPRREDRGYRTPCLIWQQRLEFGYGRIGHRQAHVIVWEAVHGPVPEGMELDHLCRQRACVEVSHLEPVTRAVNAQRGSQTKLTLEQVRVIRAAKGNVPRRDLAERFGVHPTTINDVQRYRSWRDAA